jgi:hypothetical protein
MMRSQLSTRTPGLALMAGLFCLGLATEAAAIVGAPLTPVSVAGVARRTTRRVVVASAATTSAAAASAATASAASAQASAAQAQSAAQASAAQASAAQASAAQASAAQASASQAQAQAAQAQAAAARPAGAPAVGTVVSTLPAGCVSAPKDGVEYQNCGGVYYRAAFQGNNLVYVAQ